MPPKDSALKVGVVVAMAAWMGFVPGGLANSQREEDPQSDPAYATSLPFDLRPKVSQATFHLRRPDLRSMYQAIANAYGIRLLLDADVEESKMVGNLDLENVTLPEALEAAASISNTFVAPLDEQTGIVAADTPQKRGEYERQLLSSFRADDQTTPQQLTEITTALRTVLDLRRITQDTRSNWITVRGFSRQVAAVDRFLETLQKPPGEVVLEVEIWELNVQRAQELGILPPQPFLLQFIGQAATSLGPSLLTFGQGRALFGVRLPGASGSLNFSSSVVRSHQTLELRASQGQPASLLLGERFPLVTATLSSGISSETTSLEQTAATGFFPTIQYQDIGVTLKATPYFHVERELTLQLDVAVRNLGARNPNDLPTITNRQFTEQVRLKDGESYLLGGIRTHSEQTSRSGYPWLSRLPVVGILFSVFKKQRQETELWFLLRPRILRLAPAEEFASQAIFFGKEISGLPAVVETVPAPPPPGAAPPGAPQPPGVPPIPGLPPQPGIAPQPGAPAVPPGTQPPVPIQPGLTPQQPFPQPGQPEEEAQPR